MPAKGREKPTTEIIAQFVENQTKELEHRGQELELEKQKDDHAFEYAKEALAANERDRVHGRDCERNKRRDGQRTLLFAGGILAVLLCFAMYMGHVDLAKELTKAVVYLTAGALGGYGFAKGKSTEE